MEEQFINTFKEALEIEDHAVNLEDNFKEYEEWDSLNRLNLIAMLDEEFDVQIPDDEFQKIATVQQLIDFVKKQQ